MAESIITDVVSTIFENLGSGSYKKLVYAKDLDSHIKRLQELKTTIEATLLDAAFLESCSNAQQDVLDKLSSTLAELDDFLDEQADKADLKEVLRGNKFIKAVRLFFSKSNQLVSPFRDAQKLKAIMEKFDYIARNHAKFGSIVSTPFVNQNRGWNVQMASSPILNNLVVGRDGDRDNIVSMLSEDSMATETLSVASIVGIGGMGKTTLAWYVYNDERVKRCFDVQFWVPTTQDFDFKKVLEKIIACGTGELPPNVCDIDQLYHHFLRAISGKKFLLVLDNIWDHDCLRQKWINLRSLLSLGANGSKVLLTTRIQKVAEIMDSANPYMLEGLTEADSWLLFQNIAFTQWHEPGVGAIGVEIAKMCPNFPLVIKSIGGLLAGKRTVQEWQAFRDDQLANFASYGRDIMHTLKFSYDQLDARLKLCVTYCTLFPKGFFLEQMIHRWIALGYVELQYRSQSLEEAGEEYMFRLQDCGFLEIGWAEEVVMERNFKMHDVMYELVLSLAGFRYKVADSNTDEFDKRVHHLSFYKVAANSYWEVPSSLFKIKHLQSFTRGNSTFSFGKIKVTNLSICDKLISKFQSLRVLDLHGVEIKELPASIGELTFLRFLDLSQTDIVKIPNSITKLVNLQSLYLHNCDDIEELPKDMSKLVNLRHLLLKGSDRLRHMPMGLGNLTNLRKLDVFIVSEEIESGANIIGKLADLNELNNLCGELCIEVRRESKNIMSSDVSGVNLKMKQKLKRLIIEFKYGRKEDERVLECLQPPSNLMVLSISGYGGERLPGWMMDQLESHLLVVICINNCKACRYLCSLGRLPRLQFLYLHGFDNIEYIEDSTSNNNDTIVNESPLFPSLESLLVSGMPKLKGWWRVSCSSGERVQVQQHHLINWKPAFPKLKRLRLDNVELASTIARQHLGGFTSLETLFINRQLIISEPQQLIFLNSYFPNLNSLYLIDAGELEVILESFRDLSSLERLSISYCKQIKEIPEWIDSLTSLVELELSTCPRLESLPHQISNLPNLTKLRISGCSPILCERCQSPNGEYWPLIQHIPHLSIRPK